MNTERPSRISGRPADSSLLEDYGREEYKDVAGHPGHIVTVFSDKHSCGAYSIVVECSCGSCWQSALEGCWQNAHQREESGDRSLNPDRW